MNEQEAFEAIVYSPPYEKNINKFDSGSAWPEQYRDYSVQFGWDMWQACAKSKDAEIEKLINSIKDLTVRISSQNDEIEKLCDVAKETIITLEHARIFITSKLISMHPDGIELYDENIEALRKIAYR